MNGAPRITPHPSLRTTNQPPSTQVSGLCSLLSLTIVNRMGG